MIETSSPSLPALLARRARQHPDRAFAIDASGRAHTFGDLHRRSMVWATALTRLGVRRGDTVLTMVPNSAEHLSLWIGCSAMRAIEVPINNELRGGLLAHTMRASGARTIVAAAPYVPLVLEIAGDVGITTVVVHGSDGPNDPPTPHGVELVSAEPLLASSQPAEIDDFPEAHDVACVLFTSGTTGPSKGVLIPWGNLRASALGSFPVVDLGPDDVWYGPGSGSHVGAKSMPFLFAMLGGRVVLRERLSVGEFWSDIARFGVTSTVLVGSVAHWLMQQPEAVDDRTTPLRNVLMVPVIPEYEAFNARFGTRICTVFNMTEISVPVASDGWNIEDWRSAGRQRLGEPGYEIRLVDANDSSVPVGEVGELVVRTSVPWTLNAGYLGMPEATAAAWRNGWFHTGDLLRRDEEGRYYFVDRSKDAMRVRGENVSSAEVEAEVDAHPAVMESAAVAVPADDGEDDIKIYVVVRPERDLAAEDLIAFLEPRLARFMLPRYVEFVDALPKNWRLRVEKHELRRRGIGAAWDRRAAGLARPRS